MMEITVLNEHYNPVMKRKEIRVEISHASAGTPERFSTRKALAERFNAKLESLYVVNMTTGTGTRATTCHIELYDNQDEAAQKVPEYIKVRNLPTDERQKLKEAKKEEAKPPAEKKAEEKPAEKKTEQKAEKKEVKKEGSKLTETKK
jgi:ribosomal protein S24E